MDYEEIVASLTVKVVAILAKRGISADYGAVYAWLYSQDVRREDDEYSLAAAWSS